MSSPISGILAEWKLLLMEEEIKRKFNEKILHWYRYVDDIFVILKSDTDKQDLLNNLNKIDKNIKFTIENEVNGKLNYLDVTIVKKENDFFETTVYRKPSANTEIINANCKVPYEYKLGSIRAYVNRAILICSNNQLLKNELQIIEKIAVENNFKKDLVQKMYRKRIKSLNRINPAQKPKQTYTTALPDMGKTAQLIKREAAKINYRVPIKPSLNIMQHIKSDRDQIDRMETAGIYRINYETEKEKIKGCYIGVTKRRIKERIDEHRKDIKYERMGTALARKAAKTNIKINFDESEKLANYNNKTYGFCREALEIERHQNTCNDVAHYTIDNGWRKVIDMRNRRKTKRQ